MTALESLNISTGLPEPFHGTERSCAGSKGDVCTDCVSTEGCGESTSANTAHLCSNQCVVITRQKCSQCVVNISNKAFASFMKV